MSAIATITSGELNFHNLNFQSNVDDSMRNMDFKNDSLDDSMSTNMDGKRMRKAVFRRTIDYNSSVALFIEQRTWKRKYSSRSAIQPDIMYQHLLTPPTDYRDNPMNCVCAKHVRTSTNKNKCPIYAVCWTPDGRRLITGASSGEFTLWNGLTFNFETILQAHDTHIRAMKWSNNEEWLVSADDSGFVKYWQANMNDVNVFQAHKDSVRGVSFCPSDKKFVTCSNDNTVRIWDFQTYKEERVLRGHGGEVRCVAWHPTKSLLLSGSKDSQQPLKLWDPKAGECISTMYVHKSTCTDIGINKNGNWFLTASKDHYIKLFDLRNLKSEMQVFRGHKKDVIRVAWHPYHETLFASGSGDGALLYWLVGTDMEVGAVEDAHDNIIWSLDWHPMGHILASGSNDFATKFWTRNRPGDVLKDNLQEEKLSSTKAESGPLTSGSGGTNNNPDVELDSIMKQTEQEKVFEFDIHKLSSTIAAEIDKSEKSDIPGLMEGLSAEHDHSSVEDDFDDRESKLKGSVSRTIPKQFSANWANKKSTPAVYTSCDPTNPLFNLQTNGVPVPILPGSIAPLLAIAPPAAAATIRAAALLSSAAVALSNPLVSSAVSGRIPLGTGAGSHQQEIGFGSHPQHFGDEPQLQSQAQQQPQQSLDDVAFRIMRPPASGTRGFRSGRNGAAPPPQSSQQLHQIKDLMSPGFSGGSSTQPLQFRPFLEFRGDPYIMGGPAGYDGHDQHQHQHQHQNQQYQNQQQHQFQHQHQQNFMAPPLGSHHNGNNHRPGYQQQQHFPMFGRGVGAGGDFSQNRHPLIRGFHPEFMGPPHQDEPLGRSGPFMRHRQGGRGGRINQNHHHRRARYPSQQSPGAVAQQQYHDEQENPFEPSKSTGSSKTFIPLPPQKHDEHHHNGTGTGIGISSNKRNKNNTNRVGPSNKQAASNW